MKIPINIVILFFSYTYTSQSYKHLPELRDVKATWSTTTDHFTLRWSPLKTLHSLPNPATLTILDKYNNPSSYFLSSKLIQRWAAHRYTAGTLSIQPTIAAERDAIKKSAFKKFLFPKRLEELETLCTILQAEQHPEDHKELGSFCHRVDHAHDSLEKNKAEYKRKYPKNSILQSLQTLSHPLDHKKAPKTKPTPHDAFLHRHDHLLNSCPH